MNRNLSMNTKNNPKNGGKPDKANRQTKDYSQKNSSSFKKREQIPIQSNQISQKATINNPVYEGIQLIQKLIKIMKDNSIEPSFQSSLIGYLRNYFEILNRKIVTSSQKNDKDNLRETKNKTFLNFEDSRHKDNNSSGSQKRALTQYKNTLSQKLEKIIKQQNLVLSKSFKSNKSELLLPLISKNEPQKPKQQSLTKIATQKQRISEKKEPEKSCSFLQKQENKYLKQNLKSRFFKIKNINNSEELQDQTSSNQDFNKKNSKTIFKIKPETKFKIRHDEVVKGLKKRFEQHIILIGKLQQKIKEFEKKKLKNGVNSDMTNEFKERNLLIQTFVNSCNQIKENRAGVNEEIEILKMQLQQRQEEIKNLWLFLQQNQKFPSYVSSLV